MMRLIPMFGQFACPLQGRNGWQSVEIRDMLPFFIFIEMGKFRLSSTASLKQLVIQYTEVNNNCAAERELT